jgi:hypothetical protein
VTSSGWGERDRGERGVAPIELALGILVILIPLALIALSFGPTLERRVFVRTAAAETARFIVLSEGDEARALDQLRQMAQNSGIDPAGLRLALCGGPASPVLEAPASTCMGPEGLGRGTEVEVWLEADVPVMPVPRIDRAIVRVSYRHVEMVDRYRSITP